MSLSSDINENILDELAKLNDSKTAVITNRQLCAKDDLSEEERIALIGEVVRRRYDSLNRSITEVYRNAGYAPNAMIMQFARDYDFPAKKEELNDFFELAKQGRATSEENRKKIAEKINAIPDQMIQVLMPLYHEHIKDTLNEDKQTNIYGLTSIAVERQKIILKDLNVEVPNSDEEVSVKLREVLGNLDEKDVKEIRLQEAKTSFVGSVAFAFVEQRAMEMDQDQSLKQKIQTQFRNMRNAHPTVFEGMIEKLDDANAKYKPLPVGQEIINKAKISSNEAKEVLKKVEQASKEIQVYMEGTKENPDQGLAKQLYNATQALKKAAKDEGRNESEINGIDFARTSIGSAYQNLSVEITSKGLVITQEDANARLKTIVNTPIEGKTLLLIAYEQGNKAAMDTFLKAGASLLDKTSTYKRSMGQAFKDAFSNFPKSLGQLFNKPERTLADIANLSGNGVIKQAVMDIPKESTKQELTVDKELRERLSRLEDTVGKLEEKVNTNTITERQPEILPEMNETHLISQYGESLVKNGEFLAALKSKDPEKLEHQFVEALMSYGANLFSPKESDNVAQFKKVIDGLASVGCTSAQFFRAQAMLGNTEALKQVAGVEVPSNMYVNNQQEGIRELSKIPTDARISVHPNVSSSKMSMNEFEKKETPKEGKTYRSH